MGRIYCADCGAPTSFTTQICPRCGSRTPSRRASLKGFILILLVLFIMGIISKVLTWFGIDTNQVIDHHQNSIQKADKPNKITNSKIKTKVIFKGINDSNNNSSPKTENKTVPLARPSGEFTELGFFKGIKQDDEKITVLFKSEAGSDEVYQVKDDFTGSEYFKNGNNYGATVKLKWRNEITDSNTYIAKLISMEPITNN